MLLKLLCFLFRVSKAWDTTVVPRFEPRMRASFNMHSWEDGKDKYHPRTPFLSCRRISLRTIPKRKLFTVTMSDSNFDFPIQRMLLYCCFFSHLANLSTPTGPRYQGPNNELIHPCLSSSKNLMHFLELFMKEIYRHKGGYNVFLCFLGLNTPS